MTSRACSAVDSEPPVESNGEVRCIAVINQKGGVGKTTSTVNIGAALASRGDKVLLLDVDPQANLTLHLDRRPEGDEPTMTDLLVDGKPLAEMLIETSADGLCMVPADTSLSGVETMLANRIGRETILREAIEAFDEDENAPSFDYILLDCPPSLGVLSANALVCADDIIIPMQAEYFSMQGMTKLMEVMQLVKQRLNPELSICLILPCMVDRRTNLTNEVLSELRQHFGDVLADTCIRSNVKLAEAPSFGRTIFEHAPESNGAKDYAIVADELLRRFAGTFEPAPLEEEEEDEYEEGEREEVGPTEDEDVFALDHDREETAAGAEGSASPQLEDSTDDEVRAVESTSETHGSIGAGAENDLPEAAEVSIALAEEATGIIETSPEPPADPSLNNGAPFVEAVPPAETPVAIPTGVADANDVETVRPSSDQGVPTATVAQSPDSPPETTCVALVEIALDPSFDIPKPATGSMPVDELDPTPPAIPSAAPESSEASTGQKSDTGAERVGPPAEATIPTSLNGPEGPEVPARPAEPGSPTPELQEGAQ